MAVALPAQTGIATMTALQNARKPAAPAWRNRAMTEAEKAWWRSKIAALKAEFLTAFPT